MKPLPRSFYLDTTLKVARRLLGKNIVSTVDNELLIGRIVEVEAYCHNDPASHSFRKMTKRNEVMFREGGHLYVYFTYGMHYCANIVTGRVGSGEAVLIRAVEPITGLDIMMKNRSIKIKSASFRPSNKTSSGIENSGTHKSLLNLTNGPAKFCEAFGISTKENGIDLLNSEIIITDGVTIPGKSISCSSRIGISAGLEKKWRFFVKRNPWVSK
jgi:DNA-3-methyladenine glycosylase